MASKLAVLALLSSTQAATFSADMSTIDCIGATAAGDDASYVGQYCLNDQSWSEGQCCDTTAAPVEGACSAAPQSDGAAYSTDAAFCGTRAAISNKFLKEFLMPSDTSKCPAYDIKQVTGTQVVGEHEWAQTVPVGAAAAKWHCKFGISASDHKPTATIAPADSGYIYLLAENYGFDNNVIVIVQPRLQWYDFNFRSQTNNPAKMTKVFKSSFGRKYVIPAEYDIFIDFAPISFKTNTDQQSISKGKLQFLAKWVSSTDGYENDDTVTIVDRLPPLEGTPEFVPTQSEDGGIEMTDDSVLASTANRKSEIDGTIGDEWATWKNNEAFNVAGISVTNEEAVVGSTAIIIVIVGVVCICCFVSYLERKKIGEEARRASAYAKRASQKVRRSIKSMRGQAPEEEEVEAPKTDKEIKKLASDNATNKTEKAFLNDMFTDQQKADAEAEAANNA